MSEARRNILARLAQAMPALPVIEERDGAPSLHLENPVQRLVDELQQSRAEIYRVGKPDCPAKIASLIKAKSIKQLLASDAVSAAFLPGCSALIDSGELCVQSYGETLEAFKHTLFHQVDAAITDVRAAIAETGTLVLWPDRHQPRSQSLVPPVHIALLNAADVYNSFAELMAGQQWCAGMPTNALLISGPSKTADIQQTLAYGAHGPRELVVIIHD